MLREESLAAFDSQGPTQRLVGKENIVKSAFFQSLKHAIPALVSRESSQDMPGIAGDAGTDSDAVSLQHYQQYFAAPGQGMAGMQFIAVPLQGGMQTLMQMPLTPEQLQSMGLPHGSIPGAIQVDASGQLQLPQGMVIADPAVAAAAAAAAANPAMLAGMLPGMQLSAEQMQALGLQAGDPAGAGPLDAAAAMAAAAAAAGLTLQTDLSQAGLTPEQAAAAAAAAGGMALMAPEAAAALMLTAGPAGAAAVTPMSAAVPLDPAAEQQQQQPATAVVHSSSITPGDQATGSGAVAAGPGAPADAVGGAVKPRTREEEAILAAISLTNLSKLPGPEDEAAEGAVAVNGAEASSPAALPDHAADGTFGAGLSDLQAAAVAPGPADALHVEHHHHHQQQQQHHFLHLPPHLANMQHILEGHPELLNAQLSTQDFAAGLGHDDDTALQ
jgi:hypothetical protein